MQISGRFVARATLVLLAVGLLSLLGIVGMTYLLGERAQVYFDEAIAARDARSAAVELRNAIQTAESSQRGFLATGNEIYLAPYDTAKSIAERRLEEVRRLLGTDATTRASVERLQVVLAEKLDEMDETIELKRSRRDAEALAILRSNRGKALMDEANIFFSGLIRAADERLTAGVSEQRSNSNLLRLATLVGGAVIVAVVGAAGFAIFLYTRELAAARDEVAALNAGLEERVRDRSRDLARVNEEIQRFAYIVTHDLRAPLVNIMGFTSELEEGVQALQSLIDQSGAAADSADPVAQKARAAAIEDLPEAIGFIRSSTRKMDGLIGAILKLAREGRRPLRPEAVDLREVIETSTAVVQHQLQEAEGQVELALDVPSLVTDRLSLEQIFGNILDNAVKYRDKARPLRLQVSAAVAPDNLIRIEIGDNGRGIAAQDLDRVFELFRRSGAQDQQGEGIGLAYVRTLAQKLGGDIRVRSTLGAGTTFTLLLPSVLALPESSSS